MSRINAANNRNAFILFRVRVRARIAAVFVTVTRKTTAQISNSLYEHIKTKVSRRAPSASARVRVFRKVVLRVCYMYMRIYTSVESSTLQG